MNRFIPRALAAGVLPLVLALAAAGCTGSDDVLGTPAPTPSTTIDSFSDTLILNAARTFPFVVNGAGTVTALVQTLSPDPAQIIGVALGTWNGSVCQVVLSNDSAVLNSSVTGQAAALGNFCVRVYDSTGKLPQPEVYVVQVTHP